MDRKRLEFVLKNETINSVNKAELRQMVRELFHGIGVWSFYQQMRNDGSTIDIYVCPFCKAEIAGAKPNFCPICGADMREDNVEND